MVTRRPPVQLELPLRIPRGRPEDFKTEPPHFFRTSRPTKSPNASKGQGYLRRAVDKGRDNAKTTSEEGDI